MDTSSHHRAVELEACTAETDSSRSGLRSPDSSSLNGGPARTAACARGQPSEGRRHISRAVCNGSDARGRFRRWSRRSRSARGLDFVRSTGSATSSTMGRHIVTGIRRVTIDRRRVSYRTWDGHDAERLRENFGSVGRRADWFARSGLTACRRPLGGKRFVILRGSSACFSVAEHARRVEPKAAAAEKRGCTT